MSSLILELQKEALDPNQSVTVLLRKALVVATKLDLTDAVEWIEKEQKGWEGTETEDFPEWRKVKGQIVAQNPVRGWIPVMIADHEYSEMLRNRCMTSPVSELEALLSKKDARSLHMTYHPEVEATLQRGMRFDAPVRCEITTAQIRRIVEEIRDKVLRWSLALEKAGIRGEGLSFSQEEIKQAHTINVSVYGGENNFGNIGNVSDQATAVAGRGASINAKDITNVVNEIQKYIQEIPFTPESKQAVATIVAELESEAKQPKPSTSKVVTLLKKLGGFLNEKANTILEAGMKAYVEACVKQYMG